MCIRIRIWFKKDRIRNTDRTVGAAAGLRLPRGSRHPHLECCQEGDHQLEACCSHFHNLSEMCHIVHYAYYRTVRYASIWIILLAYGILKQYSIVSHVCHVYLYNNNKMLSFPLSLPGYHVSVFLPVFTHCRLYIGPKSLSHTPPLK